MKRLAVLLFGLILLTENSNCQTNILYILADDLGYGDVGFNGQEIIETPNIDRLAENGMVLNRHYSGSTVCAPSRSSLLTGQHTGRTPVRGNKEVQPEGQAPLPGENFTLAEMLQENGYRAGCFGKWGLGYPGSEGDALNQGFDEFFGYNCQRQAHNYYPYHLWDGIDKIVLEANKDSSKEAYAPSIIHEEALDFIAKADKPFFLFYASPLPHAELAAPDSLIAYYHQKIGSEESFAGVDRGPKYKNGAYASQEFPKAAFAAMVHLLDIQVGQLIAKLEDEGLLENTLVIFTSDNGPHREGGAKPDFFNSNGELRGYKRDLYEGGIRVPTIASLPGTIKPGTESNHVSAFWDLFPTVAELIGAEHPQTDGISFLNELKGKKQETHEYLYWEFHEGGGKQAILKGNWKWIKLKINKPEATKVELFDLSTDPGETTNLAKEYPELLEEMQAIADKEHEPSAAFPLLIDQ